MILTFWQVIYYVVYYVRSCKDKCAKVRSPYQFKVPTLKASARFDADEVVSFNPVVYRQRYQIVRKILEIKRNLGGIKKVVDLGCAELNLFNTIKNCQGIQHYLAVDFDLEVLLSSIHKIRPLTADFLFKRSEPLKVTVLNGSASDPDINLNNVNVIIAIELIEHLFPVTLEELPYNIFGVVQPEIAIFTTPNVEFNVLFDLNGGFRHHDHKFEWTRSQFHDWANNLVVRYPNYEVSFSGVGPGPKGTEELGCCSQLCVFFRKEEAKPANFKEIYEVVEDVEYPYETEEEKQAMMVLHSAGKFIWNYTDAQETNGSKLLIPLSKINEGLGCDYSDDYLIDILRSSYAIERNQEGENCIMITIWRSEDSLDSIVYSDTECQKTDLDESFKKMDDEECWTESPQVNEAGVYFENKMPLQRCHSLQLLNQDEKKKFRFSLNIENVPCDMSKDKNSFCSGLESKAVDSGYPNSSQEMELDLTPEEMEELTSESDDSVQIEEVPVVRFLDNVENGDVANNNRDGEGNNMEDNQAEVFEFNIRVRDDGNENLAEPEQEQSDLDLSELDVSSNCTMFMEGVDASPNVSDDGFYITCYEISFPEWLLNVLPEEDELAGGDNETTDEQPTEEDPPEQISREETIEMIVPGDVVGGGDNFSSS